MLTVEQLKDILREGAMLTHGDAWTLAERVHAALTAHPAPVERVALTDKLIDAATIRHWGRRSAPALADHRAYARAVIAEYERANGIGTSAEVCRASQVGPDKWVCDCGGPPCVPAQGEQHD